MDYQKTPFRSTNFITLHGLVFKPHSSPKRGKQDDKKSCIPKAEMIKPHNLVGVGIEPVPKKMLLHQNQNWNYIIFSKVVIINKSRNTVILLFPYSYLTSS